MIPSGGDGRRHERQQAHEQARRAGQALTHSPHQKPVSFAPTLEAPGWARHADWGRLARRLRELGPGVRFLFISGYAEHAGELAEFVGPLGDFLGKPFTIAQLSERVRTILAAARAEDSPPATRS